MGLTMSDAVRVFLNRIVADQQLPFERKSPNATTQAAMREVRNLSMARFATGKALMKSAQASGTE